MITRDELGTMFDDELANIDKLTFNIDRFGLDTQDDFYDAAYTLTYGSSPGSGITQDIYDPQAWVRAVRRTLYTG